MNKKQPSAQLVLLILTLIWVCAFSSRLFSVVRFESIIHEFDPWFNYRSTIKLVQDGFYDFINWFDERSWYPLGRVVGGTVYPGIMFTSGILHYVLNFVLHVPIDIREICVFLAPLFSGLTSLAVFLLTKELKDATAGLFAAAFIGIAPGYISRSVAGSYDNEAIAIFLLMFTFYLWIKSVKTGSPLLAMFTSLSYFYMVSAWGGYVFITNMIPLHVFVLLIMNRYSVRLYKVYCTYYVIGLIASMQIPFVGFIPVKSNEHMAPLGVFGLMQLLGFIQFLKSHVKIKSIGRVIIVSAFCIGFSALVVLTLSGKIAPWTGRFYSLFDTEYAKKHIPIIASVSEHQPPAWGSFFFDLHFLIALFPAGLFWMFRSPIKDEHVFIIVYAIFGSYFSGVMVRLMLTLTPIVCVCAAIAISSLLQKITKFSKSSQMPDIGIIGYFVIFGLMCHFVQHSTWVTSNAYSSPSVVLASTNNKGEQVIIDDFREAYYWLRQNTEEQDKIASWWDYGYQIAGFSNRTVLVDNNTWNNSHIATVGRAMASSESDAFPILHKHDVEYLLVIFGGMIGYSGDDINKFLWMIRIGEGIYPEHVHERDFFTKRGEYKIDDDASATMKKSIMFKMSYYRYSDVMGPRGMDYVRRSPTVSKPIRLSVLEEAFTSENWIVRVFKVKKPDFLGRKLQEAKAFEAGRRRTAIK